MGWTVNHGCKRQLLILPTLQRGVTGDLLVGNRFNGLLQALDPALLLEFDTVKTVNALKGRAAPQSEA